MTRERYLPPAPEVQHLPTLLRRVVGGEIRVPAFQREYVWTEKQIIELLESIFKGYPIGSLLFWQPSSPSIAIKEDSAFPIPQSSDKRQSTYVLDGQQRLATIYNCFNLTNIDEPGKFNVTFDLRSKTFQHYRASESRPGRIHLASLFVPKAFLAVQQSLAKEKDAENLLDVSIELHAAFQEYMIPIVNVRGRETADVVRVFERVNSTGVRLGAVDFMRAVTWSESFDLSSETSELREQAESKGFELPAETLVKVLAITQGFDPTPEAMLRLRELSATTLREAMAEVGRAVSGAIGFLQRDLNIYSYEYVPYEAQLLVICKLFIASGFKPGRAALSKVKAWLLRTSISEDLQGKADSVIVNLVRSVDALVRGESKAFEGRLELVADDLRLRKFIVRRALSSALAMVFAAKAARSVVAKSAIPHEDYMSEFSASHYVPILTSDELFAVSGSREKRVFANMLLVSEDDHHALRLHSAKDLVLANISSAVGTSVLESQSISKDAADALSRGKPGDFLSLRAAKLLGDVEYLIGQL